jgi:hypothetical protein
MTVDFFPSPKFACWYNGIGRRCLPEAAALLQMDLPKMTAESIIQMWDGANGGLNAPQKGIDGQHNADDHQLVCRYGICYATFAAN